MNLLETCLTAELPMIKITTEDTLNIKEILNYYTGKAINMVTDKVPLEKTSYKYNITFMEPESADIEKVYSYLVDNERCLIFINVESSSPLVFDAGELPTPLELVRKHLLSVVDESKLPRLLSVIGGLNLLQISDVARLTMAMDGELSAHGVIKTRRMLFSRLKGLAQVDTDIPFYLPNKGLDTWLYTNSKIFLECKDPRLIPRGILLGGGPGTGKTQAAKYVSNCLQIPLYLLNLGSMLGKYVGDSESNLRISLYQVDREEPCILLLDEVEKIFKNSDDNGVVTRLLAYLLWWMQEHKSRVLTIMTTNDINVLPAELYRSGRIDTTMTFHGLSGKNALEFAKEVYCSFESSTPGTWANDYPDISKTLGGMVGEISHAVITQIVIDQIKLTLKDTL